MNLEQIEGQLAGFKGKEVSVAVPIRGTIRQAFLGKLEIRNNWEEHTISYEVVFCHEAAIAFQAQDVHKIIANPRDTLAAIIILKSDNPMEQLKYNHV